MTIKYFLQSTKNPSPIYVRIRAANNIDAKARTKWNIKPSDWSKTKGQPINLKDAHFKTLKNELDSFRQELNNEVNKLTKEDVVTTQWLKNIINPIAGNTSFQLPNELIKYIDYYVECKRDEVSQNSIKKFKVVKHKLERMEASRGEVILIKNVNEIFKTEFVEYCQQEKYSINTIHRELTFIKTFCKHARYNGIETHYQLDNLKLSKEKVEKIYLDFDELKLIEEAEMENSSLKNARDWLIISCYTGQRVSDFLNFKKELLRKEKGITLIEFTQKKTGKLMSLPLHPKVVEVLDNNKGEFPYKIADQNYNEYIKDVCKLAEINKKVSGSKLVDQRKKKGMYPKYELVTSHIGRRSFATNFYAIGIPTSLLMSATGHSTEKMFLEYIGKSSTDHALELAKYFKKA